MTTKQEAQDKIYAASKGCEAAEKEWRAATAALNGSISVNGYGIHHDRFQLRYKLLDAQKHIQEALRVIDGIDFPYDADYDLAD
jgi:uncharacterized protein YdaU (DUF1376 family)